MNNYNVASYRSFILRVRNDEPDPQRPPRWRYVLLDPEREHRLGFTSLDQLFAALAAEIGDCTSVEKLQSVVLQEAEELLGTTYVPEN